MFDLMGATMWTVFPHLLGNSFYMFFLYVSFCHIGECLECIFTLEECQSNRFDETTSETLNIFNSFLTLLTNEFSININIYLNYFAGYILFKDTIEFNTIIRTMQSVSKKNQFTTK